MIGKFFDLIAADEGEGSREVRVGHCGDVLMSDDGEVMGWGVVI